MRFLCLLALCLLLAACSGGTKKATSTTTTTASSTSTTASTVAASTTTTPPTTAANTTTTGAAPTTTTFSAHGPRVITFTGPTAAVECNAPTSIELHWQTANATKVELVIDGKVFATFLTPSFDGLQPLACDGRSETFQVVAIGANGARATATRTFTSKPTA